MRGITMKTATLRKYVRGLDLKIQTRKELRENYIKHDLDRAVLLMDGQILGLEEIRKDLIKILGEEEGE